MKKGGGNQTQNIHLYIIGTNYNIVFNNRGNNSQLSTMAIIDILNNYIII